MLETNTTSAHSMPYAITACQVGMRTVPATVLFSDDIPRSDTDGNLAAIMDLVRVGHPISPAVLQVQLLLWLDELDAARAGVPHSIVEIETEQAVARLAAALLGDGGAS